MNVRARHTHMSVQKTCSTSPFERALRCRPFSKVAPAPRLQRHAAWSIEVAREAAHPATHGGSENESARPLVESAPLLQSTATIVSTSSPSPATPTHTWGTWSTWSIPTALSHIIAPNSSRLLTVLGLVAVISALGTLVPNVAAAAVEAGASSSNVVANLISFVLHLDKHLSALIQQYGTTTYAILWAIVFCETGLVVTPFLPGDSLLFATGAFAGMGVLSLPLLIATLLSAAILGDAVNYAIGNKLGTWLTQRRMVNPRHIQQTEEFYQKYGGKTIVLARFLPIVRTFAPFVAGVGNMDYARFAMYNVAGALIWTLGFCGAGYFFGNLPAVKHNFTLVVLGIIVVSCLPVVWELYNARKTSKPSEPGTGTGTSTA